jgi:hypothetical protein
MQFTHVGIKQNNSAYEGIRPDFSFTPGERIGAVEDQTR